jgi:TRAP-type mannitol/chloroaromatic compound transport system permease small subunit
MHRVLIFVDTFSTWIGKMFAWTIVMLTVAVGIEVFLRKFFNAPTDWAFDASYIFYGTLFMMAGAYTLARNGHVRGDFLYRTMSVKRQATLDLTLYILFFFPGMIAFVYAGWKFFHLSWLLNERSAFSPAGPPIWPFKGLIPIVGVLMILQGLAESVRCFEAIQTGAWPKRLSDVEELEKVLLEQAETKRGQGS